MSHRYSTGLLLGNSLQSVSPDQPAEPRRCTSRVSDRALDFPGSERDRAACAIEKELSQYALRVRRPAIATFPRDRALSLAELSRLGRRPAKDQRPPIWSPRIPDSFSDSRSLPPRRDRFSTSRRSGSSRPDASLLHLWDFLWNRKYK